MAARPRIHPSAFIGDGVRLGVDVTVGPSAVLLGPATIGDRVWIGPGVVIGTPPEISSLPQTAGWVDEQDYRGVEIGEDTVIRELSTIHQGSVRTTRVGARTWVLNSCYIAHDCLVGDAVTLSAGTRLGGHVEIGDHANLGMNSVVHQRRIIGAGAMIGMGTPISRDVPPFAKAYGNPPRVRGVNEYALKKLGVGAAEIERLRTGIHDGDVTALLDGPVAESVRPWARLRSGGALAMMASPA
jgi:UDP-N-acetylglucosamine acyltransferase